MSLTVLLFSRWNIAHQCIIYILINDLKIPQILHIYIYYKCAYGIVQMVECFSKWELLFRVKLLSLLNTTNTGIYTLLAYLLIKYFSTSNNGCNKYLTSSIAFIEASIDDGVESTVCKSHVIGKITKVSVPLGELQQERRIIISFILTLNVHKKY